jgi:hypothetical protein
MKKMMLGLAVAVSAVMCAFGAVKESKWCRIEMPDSVTGGQSFQIKATIKKALPAGCNLSIHMHHVKSSGAWGGLYEWRPAQNVKSAGQNLVFNFTARKGSDAKTLNPMMFVAPGGDFNKKLKEYDMNLGSIAYGGGTSAKGVAKAKNASSPKPANCNYKKSWITLSRSGGVDGKYYRKGETVTVKVRYYLDPSENWGAGTTLKVIPLGPWIDNPDGVVNKGRTHVYIHGFWPQERKQVKTGENEFELTWKVETSSAPYAEMGFMGQFIGGDGKNFPWSVRGAGFVFIPEANPFRVWAESSGGLYCYGESPVVCIEGQCDATAKVALTDTEGTVFYTGTLPVKDKKIVIPPPKRRGTVLCEVTMANATKSCFFSTIPDVAKALGGKRAPFGCTNLYDEHACKAAAMIGFKYCRLFTGWAGLEPQRGKWTLTGLDRQIDNINAVGISPMITLVGAPMWVLPDGVTPPGFEPFPFDDDGWREAATHLAKHYSGRIWGFEWLNEIVPGNKTKNPVADYVRFCKIGTEAVKKVDPKMKIQLAGGLWPRSFRLDLLRAGVGKCVDVLPVHYSHHDGVVEAFSDFAGGGGKRVCDNESARGYSVWKMPPKKTLLDSVGQSVFVMRQWPGEFVAGAESVTYFGGEANSCGNWTYLLDAHTPRPVAATLAVMATKIGASRPMGAAYLEPGVIAYLFERKDGKALAFVMSANEKTSCKGQIPVGKVTTVKRTDYCGNTDNPATTGDKYIFDAKPMPEIIEGFDTAPLAASSSISIEGQGPLAPRPSVQAVLGGTAKLRVKVRNPYTSRISGVVSAKFGSAKSKPKKFVLEGGEEKFFNFEFGEVVSDMADGVVAIKFEKPSAVALRRFAVTVVNPELLGNLVKNGNMESPSGKDGAANWGGRAFKRIELDGSAPGYEGHALEMRNSSGWSSTWQGMKLPAPGVKYLYTAWVWTTDITCGSNASLSGPNGVKKDYYLPSCFSAPQTTKGWVLLTKVTDALVGADSLNITPAGRGAGRGIYDNIRVTAYENTDYAAEARRVEKAPVVDGDLSDWDTSDPIPLCCENQVIVSKGGWTWDRANISGVAYFCWDREALYFAARVKDDRHETKANDDAPLGDAITLALHPGNRVPGTDAQAEEWYISDRSPGGGSGKYTLYRPAVHGAGLKSGQLAKDSSVYDISIKTSGDVMTYELRIPWSEVPGVIPEVGAKLGMSLRLSDLDGTKYGCVGWGMGLNPVWAPSAFGVMTLVK